MKNKYIISLVLTLMILFVFQISDVSAEERMLKKGMSGQDVLALQTRLHSLGYLVSDKIDGIFGPLTMSAVIDMQRKYGIACDGIVGPATLAAMNGTVKVPESETKNSQPNVLKKGMTSDNVLNLQKKLKSLGYYQGSLDGVFGSSTLLAVIDFQATNGLTTDGVAGPQTLQTLQNSPVTANRGTSVNRKSEMIASFARQFLGTPYVWGGNSPEGFDCSGFTSYIYNHFGIQIPRMADEQFYCGAEVSQLRPGDMVFFTTYLPGPSHAGIYIGDNCFIHCSSSGGSVIITSLSQDYYSERYLGARRYIN
ncbi:MAG: peptidoglycan-binding protein [Desulfotomaculaceae bacterium]|nr:peptidoglycan-binding protein [Desulfotomaculaceae bacterium]MDD4767601.1 peptidoglycan-binding protein [Desulfotomaculaceae bacterium]